MKKIIAALLQKVLINRFTVSVYSLMSKDDIGIFTDKVFAARFDRYMMGFDREAVARMTAYRPAGEFTMGIAEIGNLSFSKLPVDTSDTSEPEVRAFTTEDVQKSEGVLDIRVVDSEREKGYNNDTKYQKDYIKDFEATNDAIITRSDILTIIDELEAEQNQNKRCAKYNKGLKILEKYDEIINGNG